MQKLYCYVDETGQDAGSNFFIVVAVVARGDKAKVQKQLEEIEHTAGTGRKKWHKLRHNNRMRYLALALRQKIASGDVYTVHYRKPIPYFFPMIEILKKAIEKTAKGKYQAKIYIDGIDRKKAKELTNALRASGVSLRIVKSRRDESEPLIRLADMWAGCLRSAMLLRRKDTKDLVKRAKQESYLHDLNA